MRLSNRTGLTLVECLISILLLSTLVLGIVGAFYISKAGIIRARHRLIAMTIVREYIENEVRVGYDGGEDEGDYYANFVSGASVPVPIDNLTGTLTCNPAFPDNIQDAGGNLLRFDGVAYKVVGFVVTWTEETLGGGRVCAERAATYVSSH